MRPNELRPTNKTLLQVGPYSSWSPNSTYLYFWHTNTKDIAGQSASHIVETKTAVKRRHGNVRCKNGIKAANFPNFTAGRQTHFMRRWVCNILIYGVVRHYNPPYLKQSCPLAFVQKVLWLKGSAFTLIIKSSTDRNTHTYGFPPYIQFLCISFLPCLKYSNK